MPIKKKNKSQEDSSDDKSEELIVEDYRDPEPDNRSRSLVKIDTADDVVV